MSEDLRFLPENNKQYPSRVRSTLETDGFLEAGFLPRHVWPEENYLVVDLWRGPRHPDSEVCIFYENIEPVTTLPPGIAFVSAERYREFVGNEHVPVPPANWVRDERTIYTKAYGTQTEVNYPEDPTDIQGAIINRKYSVPPESGIKKWTTQGWVKELTKKGFPRESFGSIVMPRIVYPAWMPFELEMRGMANLIDAARGKFYDGNVALAIRATNSRPDVRRG